MCDNAINLLAALQQGKLTYIPCLAQDACTILSPSEKAARMVTHNDTCFSDTVPGRFFFCWCTHSVASCTGYSKQSSRKKRRISLHHREENEYDCCDIEAEGNMGQTSRLGFMPIKPWKWYVGGER